MVRISDIIRAEFAEGDNKRDAGLKTPENIVRYDDIIYGTESKWQKLDVYRPKDAMGKLPVIVSVHGGGWVYGDKERYQFYCMDLAERGFAVVNFLIAWHRNISFRHHWKIQISYLPGFWKTQKLMD